MAVETDTPTSEQTTSEQTISEYTSLDAEAKRLLEFKEKNVKNQNQTLCPECATLIHISAIKCAQCGSDVREHTARIREELGRLKEITAELQGLHSSYMECCEEESTARPAGETAKAFLSDSRMREDLKIVLPSFLLFFALIAALRLTGNEALFWGVTLPGGFIAYFLLKRSNVRKHVTIDLYRTALVVGLILAASAAAIRPLPDSPDVSFNSMIVQTARANIRESATTDSRVVTTVSQGDEVRVVGRQGAWYSIETEDGQTGWVYSSLVRD